ncbi:MAG: transposase [Planctomycetales bacterium]|nr:transposase [Planctomycetales bacterium]
MQPAINLLPIERYWFLTWTTYGSWLPGDKRGFVGLAPDESGRLVMHNIPRTPLAPPRPGLKQSAEERMKSDVVFLNIDQAEVLLPQFQETTQHRRWLLAALAIMQTHLHLVVGVTGDPDPDKILGDLKAYGSRSLNRLGPHREDDTWWTTGGSKQKLASSEAVDAAVNYIRQQPNPLLIWTRDDGIVFSTR